VGTCSYDPNSNLSEPTSELWVEFPGNCHPFLFSGSTPGNERKGDEFVQIEMTALPIINSIPGYLSNDETIALYKEVKRQDQSR